MNKEETWKMALASGLCDPNLSSDEQLVTDYGDATDVVEKFAAMVADKTRKECASLCVHLTLDHLDGHGYAAEILNQWAKRHDEPDC